MAMGSVRSSNSSCIIPQTWSSWWLRYDNVLLISWGGDYHESGDGNDDFCYYEAYITSICRELAPKEEVNEVDLENIFAGKVWETFPKLNKQSSWFGKTKMLPDQSHWPSWGTHRRRTWQHTSCSSIGSRVSEECWKGGEDNDVNSAWHRKIKEFKHS